MQIKAASAIVLALLSIFIIKTFKNPFVFLCVVVGSGLTIIKLDEKTTPGDYLAFSGTIGKEISAAFDPITVYQGAKKIFIDPDKSFKAVLDIAKDVKADYGWFRDFRTKSILTVGISGDGKTSYQLNEVASFIEDHPKGFLKIGDIDYGLSHEGSEPNYWFELPKQQYISVRYEEILEDFRYFSKLIDERVKEGNEKLESSWPWAMHVVDELIAFIQLAKDNDNYDEVMVMVKKILNRGLKVRVKCCYGVQNLSFTDTGISLVAQESFNIVLLGSSAINRDYLKRIGATSTKQQDSIIERVEAVRKIHPYSCVVRIKQKIAVQTLPAFDNDFVYENPNEIWKKQCLTENVLEMFRNFAPGYSRGEGDIQKMFDIAFADTRPKQQVVRNIIASYMKPVDDVESWWIETYTDDLRHLWEDSAKGYQNGTIRRSPLKSCMGKIFKTGEMRKDNPRYLRAKKEWDSLLAKY